MEKETDLKEDESLYFYIIRSTAQERELCNFEMKYLFNIFPQRNYFKSFHYVLPSRSAFIKQCISILYSCDTLNELVERIIEDKLSYENFKIKYINLEDTSIGYHERRRIEYLIGFNVLGEADVHNPEVVLGVVNVDGKWILGELDDNKNTWNSFNHKPYSYSNALGVRVARSLVNIAVGNNLELKIVDPCCGIGTVVIEALSMGLNIKGFEINPYIAENAKSNLEFFGFKDTISNCSMHDVDEKFDVAIVDLPYGVFTPVTLEEQLNIISTTRRLADKAVLITFENMEDYFRAAGFTPIDRCIIAKGTFKRYITVCK